MILVSFCLIFDLNVHAMKVLLQPVMQMMINNGN